MKDKLDQLNWVVLFSVVTFAVFMPSSLFLGNTKEFPIGFEKVLPIILVTGGMLFLIEGSAGVLFKKHEKCYFSYINLLFGVTLGFYLQGNFINGNLPRLDGGDIIWDNWSTRAIVSAAVWGICLLLPEMMLLFRVGIWNKIRNYACIFLTSVQLLTLLVLVLTPQPDSRVSYVVTNEGEFELGSKDNIVVFILDMLDAQYAEDYIIDDDQYAAVFKDFVYFDNVVAGGATTPIGVPTLLTGVTYDNPHGMSPEEYCQLAYNSSTLFKDLQENDYTVRLFTDFEYIRYADFENIDNIVENPTYEISSPRDFAIYLYRLTAFYAMPYQLKHYFVFYTKDFVNIVSVAGTNEGVGYSVDDPRFYHDFQEHHLSLDDHDNHFMVYHLEGAHPPYCMNENGEYVDKKNSSLEQQIHGVLKILSEYFDQMKELGIYDNSTIIVTADHGGIGLDQNPAVFIKEAYYQTGGSLERNSGPATFKNVRASMAKGFLEDYSAYGAGLFDDLSENIKNGRYHTTVAHLRELALQKEPTGWDYDRYKIGDSARDLEAVEDAEEQ